MNKISKELLFGDALDGIDIGGLANMMPDLQNLISGEGNPHNNNNNNNEDSNSNPNNDFQSSENDMDIDMEKKRDENDLGIDVICDDEEGKIYKLTDLIIPLYDSKKEATENYLRKMIERVKKDKNEKNEKDDIKKREKNEKEEI